MSPGQHRGRLAAASESVDATRTVINARRSSYEDSGLDAAIDNADDWWSDCAWRALRWMAELEQPFTAWDLVQLGVPEPDDPHRWGGLFRRAAQLKIIRGVGYAPSQRPTAAGSIARVWQGVPRPTSAER